MDRNIKCLDVDAVDRCVVPYVGTWIEIKKGRALQHVRHTVVPYVGTWIEIIKILLINRCSFSRSLRGNVDRNSFAAAMLSSFACRSLRGNVDRNYFLVVLDVCINRRSLRGNVDRNAPSMP